MAGGKVQAGLKTAIGISLLVIIVIPLGIIFIPEFGIAGVAVWLVGVGSAIYLIVKYHSQSTTYKCPGCGRVFMISVWQDFISPHFPDKKRLRCPGCGKRDWCKVV